MAWLQLFLIKKTCAVVKHLHKELFYDSHHHFITKPALWDQSCNLPWNKVTANDHGVCSNLNFTLVPALTLQTPCTFDQTE